MGQVVGRLHMLVPPPHRISPSLSDVDKTVDAKLLYRNPVPTPCHRPIKPQQPGGGRGLLTSLRTSHSRSPEKPSPARAWDARGQHPPTPPAPPRVPAPEQAASVLPARGPAPALLCTSAAAAVYRPPPGRLLPCLTSLDTLPGRSPSLHFCPWQAPIIAG